MALQTDEFGKLDLALLSVVDPAELRVWLVNRLNGHDDIVSGGTELDEDRHVLLQSLFQRLELRALALEHLRTSLVELMESYAKGDLTGLTAEGMELLLQVVEPAFATIEDRNRVTRVVITLLRQTGSDRLRMRALQALVGLDYRAPTDFWLAFSRYGADFLPVILEGLGRVDLYCVFKVFADWQRQPKARETVAFLLPSWLELYRPRDVATAIELVAEDLTDETRSWLQTEAEANGLRHLDAPTKIDCLFPAPQKATQPLITLSELQPV